MSRIGKKILTIPENVSVNVDGNTVSVKGPNGELSTEVHEDINVIVEDNTVRTECKKEDVRNFQGTANANINNMLVGVSEGFAKTLEIVGVGYRFNVKGDKLVVAAGYSQPKELNIPPEITVENPSNTQIVVKGIDKYLVGEFAAKVRAIKKPEPYKGKGIKYIDEYVIRKAGKKASK